MRRVMSDRSFFTIAETGAPRLGKLSLPGRNSVNTPHYFANTSRGVVPHLTQDTLVRSTAVCGVYAAVEDFIERNTTSRAPVFEYSNDSRRLRHFLAIPDDKLLVLGARRSPPVAPPPATSNTDTSVAVSTSVGFRYLNADTYPQQVDELRPDIVVGLADQPIGRALAAKRIERATDRSIEWVTGHLAARNQSEHKNAYFASLLPVSCAAQQYYIDELVDAQVSIDGLAIYSLDTLLDLPEALRKLPKLDLTEVATPLQVLQHVGQGVDLMVLPFIDVVTDAGLAMIFSFGKTAHSKHISQLGLDMWNVSHATDLSPLVPGCSCYACVKHHRAYIQHLLSAKEMLGWVLLQIHNHHTMDQFFEAIRISVQSKNFAADVEAFQRAYEPGFPLKTGQGPRVRGYQRRSEKAHEPKVNPPAFVRYKDENAVPRSLAKMTTPKVSGLPDDLDLALFAEGVDG